MTPQQLTEEIKTVCEARLQSVILYGSAATGEHIERRSDYNVLVVLDRLGLAELKALTKTAESWVKAGNSPPLLFTRDRLAKSAHVFPIEIADMQGSYRVLFGEDIVATLPLHDGNLRYQLEADLKGKLITLREHYLFTRGKPRLVTDLLIASLSSFLVLFRAALRLFQSDVPNRKMDALLALARRIPFDTRPFETVKQMKEGHKVPGLVADDLFAEYLRAVETVVDAVHDILHKNA